MPWQCPACNEIADDSTLQFAESNGSDFRCSCGYLETFGRPNRDLRRRTFNAKAERDRWEAAGRALEMADVVKRAEVCHACPAGMGGSINGIHHCKENGGNAHHFMIAKSTVSCPLGFWGTKRILHFHTANEAPKESKRRTCWQVTDTTTLAELQAAICDTAPAVIAAMEGVIGGETWERLQRQNPWTRFVRFRRNKLRDVTICVTSHKRPEALRRCLTSIQQHYPQMRVETIDTQGNVSRGRNRLVDRVQTKYILLLEDDMELTTNTDIIAMLDVVESDSEIAGCGGLLIEPKRTTDWCHDFVASRGEIRGILARDIPQITSSGVRYQTCDLIKNFGVFRTDILRECQWNERLELGEHREFFWRLSKKWRVAITPDVSVNHYSDRPSQEYNADRSRAHEFVRLAGEEIGLKLGAVQGVYSPPSDRPSIVVLGVGHSNTTITTKQLAALGWNLGDADEEYAESVAVRQLNDDAMRTGELDVAAAKQAIANLRAPWVIKDPRFAKGTLPLWLPIWERHKPLLLWIQKDTDRVKQSYRTRGESDSFVEAGQDNCRAYYNQWPWSKITLRAEAIAAACDIFDMARSAASVIHSRREDE